MAEKALVDGQAAGMIALGCALLADPQWPQKTKSGCIADIRPCIACYEGCFQNYYRGRIGGL
jgi:2,4-dienoyl-CoA reductase-like NADH-dependent reductase (Old Yellow Enzyme family)